MTPSSETFDDDPARERLVDLALGLDPGLEGSAVESLGEAEREELEEFELAAAALYLGFRQQAGATDETLARPERERALERFREMTELPAQAPARRPERARVTQLDPAPAQPSTGMAGVLPWLIAAGALIVFGVSFRNTRIELDTTRAELARANGTLSSTELARAAEALAADPATTTINWTALEDDYLTGSAPTGAVLWNAELEQGFMRFEGLPANDSEREQYQLWIFDRRLPDATPIDGGVFDIKAGAAEVVVPIDAKIDVDDAWRFAITLEPPGGVVVSSREHLLLLADS